MGGRSRAPHFAPSPTGRHSCVSRANPSAGEISQHGPWCRPSAGPASSQDADRLGRLLRPPSSLLRSVSLQSYRPRWRRMKSPLKGLCPAEHFIFSFRVPAMVFPPVSFVLSCSVCRGPMLDAALARQPGVPTRPGTRPEPGARGMDVFSADGWSTRGGGGGSHAPQPLPVARDACGRRWG